MKEGESFLFSVIGQSRGRSIGCVGRGLIVRGRAGGGHKDRLPSPPPPPQTRKTRKIRDPQREMRDPRPEERRRQQILLFVATRTTQYLCRSGRLSSKYTAQLPTFQSDTMNHTGQDDPLASILSNSLDGPSSSSHSQGPVASADELLACQCSTWIETFSNLSSSHDESENNTTSSNSKRKSVTIRTKILADLPPDFQEYLESDGLRLPVDATKLSNFAPNEQTQIEDDSDDEHDDSENDSDNNSDDAMRQFSFPELNRQLTEAIASLGGAVLPKLNWSAPKDATWVHGGTLKCETPGDVYLLLKSSDFCMHDLSYSRPQCGTPPLQLVVRKWCNLHPSMEFRCFIRQGDLLAISQRNHTQHYAHLASDMTWVTSRILDFFYDIVQERIEELHQHRLQNYVMDVYLDKQHRVWLVDFNVWASSTDALLFEWSELTTLDLEEDPYVRIVETPREVRQDPLSSYRAPIDTVDLASMTRGDKDEFEKFMKLCQKPSELSDGGNNDSDDGE